MLDPTSALPDQYFSRNASQRRYISSSVSFACLISGTVESEDGIKLALRDLTAQVLLTSSSTSDIIKMKWLDLSHASFRILVLFQTMLLFGDIYCKRFWVSRQIEIRQPKSDVDIRST